MNNDTILYFEKEIYNIIHKNGWSSTMCTNELNGEHSEYFDTLQVEVDDGADYFGEFVIGKISRMGYFRFYINN